MIKIFENDIPNQNKVSLIDKLIGVVNNNNSDNRVFVFPKNFKGFSLDSPIFTTVLQIQDAGKKEPPYFQMMDKTINEDAVHYMWNITRYNTRLPGGLLCTILISNEEKDIVWQSYTYEFIVVDGINAAEPMENIPPSILEQYVAQASSYAKEAKDEADKLTNMIIETGAGHIIMDEHGEELSQRKKLQIFGGVVLEDDSINDITKVHIIDDIDDHSMLLNLDYSNSGHTGFASETMLNMESHDRKAEGMSLKEDLSKMSLDLSVHKIESTAHLDIRTDIINESQARIESDTSLLIRINEALAIAEGATHTRIKLTEVEARIWIDSDEGVAWRKPGFNILVVDLKSPDFWWDGTQLQVLGTEKIDLTEYLKEDEIRQLLDGKVKISDFEILNNIVDDIQNFVALHNIELEEVDLRLNNLETTHFNVVQAKSESEALSLSVENPQTIYYWA